MAESSTLTPHPPFTLSYTPHPPYCRPPPQLTPSTQLTSAAPLPPRLTLLAEAASAYAGQVEGVGGVWKEMQRGWHATRGALTADGRGGEGVGGVGAAASLLLGGVCGASAYVVVRRVGGAVLGGALRLSSGQRWLGSAAGVAVVYVSGAAAAHALHLSAYTANRYRSAGAHKGDRQQQPADSAGPSHRRSFLTQLRLPCSIELR